jgi:hypothetical protein
MKMTRKIEGTVLAIAVAAAAGIAGPSVASAAEVSDRSSVEMDAAKAGAVLIVNNHMTGVTVFAVDEEGNAQELGRLESSGVQEFTVPENAVDSQGAVIIKVLPDSPLPGLGTPVSAAYGVKTRVSVGAESDAVVFWLEPELTESFTEVVKG